MYKIGLIEDNLPEASAVSLSIVENSQLIGENDFKLYDLAHKDNFKELLLDEIKEDIIEGSVHCLIVDYKLDTLQEVMEGIEVVKFIHDLVPEFPVIILTNVPASSKENDKVDPDKVYSKDVFMNPDLEETKSMVYNIERNLERYVKNRASLELRRENEIEKLNQNDNGSDEAYANLINIEIELSKFVPLQMNTIDQTFNMQDMDEALELLKQYKNFLE